MLTYTGILKTKGQTIKVSEKFQKREFVLTDNASSYPQTILFQLTQDRCSLIENAQVGDEVNVHFLLKGREWKNPQGEVKVFNSLDVFRVDVITKNATMDNLSLDPIPSDDLPF